MKASEEINEDVKKSIEKLDAEDLEEFNRLCPFYDATKVDWE